jgi:hypothetical protein
MADRVIPEYMDFEIPEGLQVELEEYEGAFNPDRVVFLIYGESGVGKTVFSSTWPKPVFLDMDKGLSSVRRKVHRFKIDFWEDLMQALQFLKSGEHPFGTIILDSLNELQALTMRNVIQSNPGIRRSYNDLPGIGDYGKMLFDVDNVVRFLRGLPYNIVLTAQVAPREMETDPILPQLIGKNSARNVARMVDIVGFLEKKDSAEGPKTRVMIFDGVNIVTKDRSGVLPVQVENPTYENLLKYWLKPV